MPKCVDVRGAPPGPRWRSSWRSPDSLVGWGGRPPPHTPPSRRLRRLDPRLLVRTLKFLRNISPCRIGALWYHNRQCSAGIPARLARNTPWCWLLARLVAIWITSALLQTPLMSAPVVPAPSLSHFARHMPEMTANCGTTRWLEQGPEWTLWCMYNNKLCGRRLRPTR